MHEAEVVLLEGGGLEESIPRRRDSLWLKDLADVPQLRMPQHSRRLVVLCWRQGPSDRSPSHPLGNRMKDFPLPITPVLPFTSNPNTSINLASN